MVDRIADDADLVVDELKRKARRRLIGAIVLALAAAIILPMLLEKEPRPLGDDVSVQIPPVDEGRFINRLTGKSGDVKPLPKAEDRGDPKAGQGKPESKPEAVAPALSPQAKGSAPAVPLAGDALVPKKSVAEAEQRALSPASKPPAKADAKSVPETKAISKPATAEPKAAPKSAPAEPKAAAKTTPTEAQIEPKTAAAEATSDPKVAAAPPKAEPTVVPAEPKVEAKQAPDAKSEPKPAAAEPKAATVAATPSATPAAAAAPTKVDGFVVQLAAFADDKGANALANKLKKTGYAAYVEPVQTSRGTLWRVRVGGYGSRPDADAARVKLKGEGYSGIVAPTK